MLENHTTYFVIPERSFQHYYPSDVANQSTERSRKVFCVKYHVPLELAHDHTLTLPIIPIQDIRPDDIYLIPFGCFPSSLLKNSDFGFMTSWIMRLGLECALHKYIAVGTLMRYRINHDSEEIWVDISVVSDIDLKLESLKEEMEKSVALKGYAAISTEDNQLVADYQSTQTGRKSVGYFVFPNGDNKVSTFLRNELELNLLEIKIQAGEISFSTVFLQL